MTRFGAHSCMPNAVALLGDVGRTVRLVATAPIASLDDVRINRDSSNVAQINVPLEFRCYATLLFGYQCACTRCVVGEENDPANYYLLRCPLFGSSRCGGSCKGLYFDTGRLIGPGSCFNLPFPTNDRGAAAAARLRNPWTRRVSNILSPCSACNARYAAETIANDVVEAMLSLVMFAPSLTSQKKEDVERAIALAKQYFHSTSGFRTDALNQKFNYITGSHMKIVLGKVQMMQNLVPGYSVTTDRSCVEEKVGETDFMREYLEQRLEYFGRVLAGDKDAGEKLEFALLPTLIKHSIPTCIKYCQLRQRVCRDGTPQVYARLAALSREVKQKAQEVVSRVLTPKQFEKFLSLPDKPDLPFGLFGG